MAAPRRLRGTGSRTAEDKRSSQQSHSGLSLARLAPRAKLCQLTAGDRKIGLKGARLSLACYRLLCPRSRPVYGT